MGINAQTTVPTFTVGQVLTSAQMIASASTGIPVFATTVTRDAAFGGGNKALAQGQMAFVETAGLQFYNGSAWVTAGYTDTYTPVWTTSGVAPVLGNGSLTGRFYRYDKFVFFSIAFVAGSTTTFGTGNFEFSTPTAVASNNNYGYQCVILDSGTAWITKLLGGNGPVAGLSDKFLILDDLGNAVTSTNPMTWSAANGDSLFLQGSYLIS
jgi:hypothetical protein